MLTLSHRLGASMAPHVKSRDCSFVHSRVTRATPPPLDGRTWTATKEVLLLLLLLPLRFNQHFIFQTISLNRSVPPRRRHGGPTSPISITLQDTPHVRRSHVLRVSRLCILLSIK